MTATDEKLTFLQTRLAHVVDSIPGVVGSFALRPDGRIDMLFLSGAVRLLYGFDADQIVADIAIVNARVHPEDLEGVRTSVQQSARTLAPWHHEWRYLHPERRLIWLEAQALPQREADERVLWHGYVQDSTARKLAERALLASDRALIEAQSLAHVGSWTESGDGRMTWSPETQRIFGLPPGIAPTREAVMAVIHPDDIPVVARADAALRGGELHTCEFRVRVGGETRWLRSRGKFELDANGHPVGGVGTVQDVTERVVMLATLERQQQDLERTVAERTRQLEAANRNLLEQGFAISSLNEQLARRAHEAEAASRAKTAFLANMSHEIRTPMNAILGFTDLLSRHPRDPADAGRLQQIGEAARHLLSIIDDVLDLSKIEAGKLALEFSDFDLEDLVREVCALFDERAQAKGLELRLEVEDPPGRVRGDATRLRQALINYLSNAVKFTERGSITTRIATLARQAHGLTARIEIEDTGIGVDAPDQPRLFEPFEQGDGSTTRRFGGTGLGLAINRRLAALMGGEVGVRSTLGAGSCFWMTVELGAPAEPVASDPSMPELGGLEILLVDEDSGSCAALVAMLAALDLEVTALTTASVEQVIGTALRADRSGRHFAAVVVTARSPGDSAWRLAERLRTLALRRRLPCLVLTEDGARPSGPTDERGSTAEPWPADARLALPVTVTALRLALQRIVRADAVGAGRRAAILFEEERLRRRYHGAHVLVAEDHPLNQRVACDMLQLAGLSFDVASNGEQAVELARHGRYDLVLMDVHMPVMNGLDAGAAIRQLAGYAHTPIIAMSADGFDEDLNHCRRAGMDDLLMKPVAAETFFATLGRWLDVASLRGAPGARAPGTRAPEKEELEDIEGELAMLPGVEPALGMKFARGRLGVYLELLHMFADPSHVEAAGLASSAAARRTEDLRERAHALKGVAALIGATRIQALVSELEALLRAGGEDAALERSAAAIDAEFTRLAVAIRRLPASGDPRIRPGQLPSPFPGDGARLLDELDRALEQGEFGAHELVQRNSAVLKSLLGSEADALERHVTAFAFEAARRVLQGARYSSTA